MRVLRDLEIRVRPRDLVGFGGYDAQCPHCEEWLRAPGADYIGRADAREFVRRHIRIEHE